MKSKFLDFSPRGAGKTTRMMDWLAGDFRRLLIVITHREELRLKREYPNLKNQIIDWESYRSAYPNGHFKEVGIDNLEMVIQSMVREPIKKISISDLEE